MRHAFPKRPVNDSARAAGRVSKPVSWREDIPDGWKSAGSTEVPVHVPFPSERIMCRAVRDCLRGEGYGDGEGRERLPRQYRPGDPAASSRDSSDALPQFHRQRESDCRRDRQRGPAGSGDGCHHRWPEGDIASSGSAGTGVLSRRGVLGECTRRMQGGTRNKGHSSLIPPRAAGRPSLRGRTAAVTS